MNNTYTTSNKYKSITQKDIKRAQELIKLRKQNSLEKLFRDNGFSYEDGDYLLLTKKLFDKFKRVHMEHHENIIFSPYIETPIFIKRNFFEDYHNKMVFEFKV